MKSFDKLEPLALGEVLTFLGSRSRRTLSGVTDGPTRVMVQRADAEEPVLFHAFGAGQFSFEMADLDGFNLWFETADGQDRVVSVVVPPHSTVLVGDPERMFTKVDFRPAMDPALAAIHRELAALRGQVKRFNAPPAPTFKKPVEAPADAEPPAKAPDASPDVGAAPAAPADADAGDEGAKE